MIRALVLALSGFIVAWIAATAYFLIDSTIQNELAGTTVLHTVWRYGLATYTYGYLGGLLGLAAAVSISRTRSVFSQIALWSLLGLVITCAVAVVLHHHHFDRLPTTGEFCVLVGRLRMLLIPTIAVCLIVPLTEAVWDSAFWKVRRIRRPKPKDVGGDINFDAVAYSELEKRANTYLYEKRKKSCDVPVHQRAEEMSLLHLDSDPKQT